MRYVWAIFASIAIFIVFTIIKVFYSAIIGNYKEEHLNELSKEVYIALGVSEIIPFIIAIVLIRIVWKKITYKESEQISSNNRNETSIIKAVYNHTKDVAREVKPTINEYKEKYSSTNESQQNSIELNEDEIYEKVMIEIEEDKKVKSTWAKALAQSDGNKDKAISKYINMRVQKFKSENTNQNNNLKNDVNNIIKSNKSSESNNCEEKLINFLKKENLIVKEKISEKEVIAYNLSNPFDLKLIYNGNNWLIDEILNDSNVTENKSNLENNDNDSKISNIEKMQKELEEKNAKDNMSLVGEIFVRFLYFVGICFIIIFIARLINNI